MLDLDILLNAHAGISDIPAVKWSESLDTKADPCFFYTKRLHVEEGCAGYFVTDEFLFCGKIVQKDTGIVILVGPATEHQLSLEAVSRITKEVMLTGPSAKELRKKLNALPLMTLKEYLQHLSFLNYIINENSSLLPRNSTGRSFQRHVKANPTDSIFHNTAEFENALMQCVEHGKLDLIQPMLKEAYLSEMNMGSVSDNSLRALKNVFITSATLACRAAVRGGLDYDRAMSLSDAYIQQIEGIDTYDAFQRLFTQMLLDLTKRTKDLNLHSNCSELVRKVAQDINGKLYQKITVEQLAADHNVSSSYLSHHFKQETGKTLTDYIAQQKIEEAKRLLQTTDLSLAQVAYQLAFSSQSYFHAVFKKVTGINPGKYPRSQHYSAEES